MPLGPRARARLRRPFLEPKRARARARGPKLPKMVTFTDLDKERME